MNFKLTGILIFFLFQVLLSQAQSNYLVPIFDLVLYSRHYVFHICNDNQKVLPDKTKKGRKDTIINEVYTDKDKWDSLTIYPLKEKIDSGKLIIDGYNRLSFESIFIFKKSNKIFQNAGRKLDHKEIKILNRLTKVERILVRNVKGLYIVKQEYYSLPSFSVYVQ